MKMRVWFTCSALILIFMADFRDAREQISQRDVDLAAAAVLSLLAIAWGPSCKS